MKYMVPAWMELCVRCHALGFHFALVFWRLCQCLASLPEPLTAQGRVKHFASLVRARSTDRDVVHDHVASPGAFDSHNGADSASSGIVDQEVGSDEDEPLVDSKLTRAVVDTDARTHASDSSGGDSDDEAVVLSRDGRPLFCARYALGRQSGHYHSSNEVAQEGGDPRGRWPPPLLVTTAVAGPAVGRPAPPGGPGPAGPGPLPPPLLSPGPGSREGWGEGRAAPPTGPVTRGASRPADSIVSFTQDTLLP